MLRAALTSACSAKPHDVHEKVAWSGRLFLSTCPQGEHCWLDGHFWSPSYLAASCGGAPLSIIKEYIDSQKRPG
jgi:REP element-mobilizing transposase RayT